jgi:cob(I)alamin adenosyltransferase
LSVLRGLIHIYTGDGKGKTTAALGLSLRAYGGGFKIGLIQFLKGMDTGELAVLAGLGDSYQIHRNKGIIKFVKDMNGVEIREAASDVRKLWELAKSLGTEGQCDLLILDEVMAAIATGLLSLDDVCGWLKEKPAGLEVVLTGRDAPPALVDLADYVSEIKAVKHPYEKGIAARKGIEF